MGFHHCAALASECLDLGRFDEALRHYDHILSLPLGHDPIYALSKARAHFGANRPADAVATLDQLKAQWPDFESQEGHLLYARALGEAGRIDEAFEEYASLTPYFSGAEARVRYGLLLQTIGRTAGGQGGVQRIAAADEARAKVCPEDAGRMLAIAEKQLSA